MKNIEFIILGFIFMTSCFFLIHLVAYILKMVGKYESYIFILSILSGISIKYILKPNLNILIFKYYELEVSRLNQIFERIHTKATKNSLDIRSITSLIFVGEQLIINEKFDKSKVYFSWLSKITLTGLVKDSNELDNIKSNIKFNLILSQVALNEFDKAYNEIKSFNLRNLKLCHVLRVLNIESFIKWNFNDINIAIKNLKFMMKINEFIDDEVFYNFDFGNRNTNNKTAIKVEHNLNLISKYPTINKNINNDDIEEYNIYLNIPYYKTASIQIINR